MYDKKIKEYIQSFNVVLLDLNSDEKPGIITTEEVYKIEKSDTSEIKEFKYKYKFNDFINRYQIESIEENK